MSEDLLPKVLNLIYILPVLIVGLAIHEAAHAWSAYKLGDDTAQRQGRLTLNPLVHIDPFGLVFMVFAWLSGVGFGWAKPVPVDPRQLRHPFRDMAIVAAAGPISNVLQAFAWLGILWAVKGMVGTHVIGEAVLGTLKDNYSPDSFATMFAFWGSQGILLNLFLAAFNLIPVPPLDGSRIAVFLMPTQQKEWMLRLEPYGFFILLILLQVGVLRGIGAPVFEAWA
ncbi:MAG: site-2 protease family protein, partial [Abditibacteriales bacterium]|nr:site-2 protease family protein [Abditibacteriales bacterium]MDW8364279.1 site-2 protease family protein [Abditibacteriales bacterium]